MAEKDQNQTGEVLANNQTADGQTILPSSKRRFVEPEISQPIDVLEATTFFQSVDSGPTN